MSASGSAAAPRGAAGAAVRRPAAVLTVGALAHFVHDGFADVLYLFFPIWTGEFALTFAQVGLLKTAYSGGMAAFQIPAGLLAERWGERRLLAAGTAVTALAFVATGHAAGFGARLACLLIGGLGSGVQHPLSSSMVSRAYEAGSLRTALGTYNFSGDLGKTAIPVTVGLATGWLGWRTAGPGYGLVGLAAAAVVLVLLARLGAGGAPARVPAGAAAAPATQGWGIRDLRGFVTLSTVHVIDNTTRSAFLTFLPFLLVAKGASIGEVGFALMLVFAGGAAGKLACGALADRVGVIRTVVITEAATGVGILLLLTLPLGAILVVLPPLGIALNGTSSVLYGSVADLVAADRRARAYGLFYTVGVTSSATAPFAYGLVSDHLGLRTAITVIGLVVFLVLPLVGALRRSIAPAPARA